ncbi:aldehyde dehydrogenase family protein [Methylobacterium sp. E-066]|uniref:aldehyde dehydrogenase family protein n=1 Tax=Methylobacterium sp. E-066 TaxID=2836584 RepID=UPI001FB95221|nr:aldehyde dehydrogenase family protein [Methylobacterium sp. E-066]MCJ2141587.1 aldehyde dehydrogenase family protein [Methylobacterium sp. E-066]
MANHVPASGDVTRPAPAAPEAPRPYAGFDGQYIGGAWRHGRHGGKLPDDNPYSGERLAVIVMADRSDLDAAYEAAAKAQRAWADRLPAERAAVMVRALAILEARHGEIVDWLVREAGSTRAKAELEWQFVQAVTRDCIGFPYRVEGRILPLDEPNKESRVYRQPLGVIGVISPWNFPMYLSVRSVAPALALGNAVVLKPAEDTPVTGGLLIAKVFEEAGLPPGLLNVVIGPIEEIGDAFTLHPVPRFISFTGSTRVGRHIGQLAMTGPSMKRVGLELGGNAPLVVLDDADLEHAVRAAVVGRFLHQGQICMSTNRIIVDAKIYDVFVDRFTAHVRTLKYGDPNDPSVAIGPVINARQLKAHLAHIAGARSSRARQVLGGEPEGLVLPPHVFADVTNDMPLAQDEMFGPIAPIIKAHGEAHALALANDTPFGLSSAVFTRDPERGVRFALGVEAGMTHVNDHTVDDSPTGPFGGEKNSGIGRFGGQSILHEFTREHWVTVRSRPAAYPF